MMAVPKKRDVITKIQENLPSSLLTQPIWIPYYYVRKSDGTYSKPPCKGYTVKDSEPGVTFLEAIAVGYPGIKINKWTNLIAFDIDDKEAKLGKREFDIANLSPQFQEFIAEHDSYMEMSPSGCGLRILFTCVDKSNLPGRVNLLEELCIGGELFINSGYVTITGDRLAGEEIKTIDRADLTAWYKGAEVIDLPNQEDRLPALRDVWTALNACSLTQSDQVKRAYKSIIGEDYSHYTYWIKILAACHDFAIRSNQQNEMVTYILDWSATDPQSYQNEDDVLIHWVSFTKEDIPEAKNVSYHTLFKFARLMKFEWPEERYDKKGKPTGKPLPNVYKNFHYLMNYYGLTVATEPYTSGVFVEGDSNILKKYFIYNNNTFFGAAGPFDVEQVTACCWQLAQDNHYDNVTLGTVVPLVRSFLHRATKQESMLAQWINTPYEQLPDDVKEPNTNPECSNIDYLMSCIQFNDSQNMELAKAFLDAFFSGIVMPVYNPDRMWAQHNFMLVLTGPENSRKSTFLSMLMPTRLAQYFISHSTETLSNAKSLRDFMIQMTSSAILVVDEFEIFYSRKNDSLFKTLVTADSCDYVPIYSMTKKTVQRQAALAGTTNLKSLPIEQNSSRRIAMLDINWIDTDKVKEINWHTFYNYYVRQGKAAIKLGKFPWKLKQSVIDMQYVENEQFRSKPELEMVIEDIFDFDYPFPGLDVISTVQADKTWLYNQSALKDLIRVQHPDVPVKLNALKHTMRRLCGKWTGTLNATRQLPHCDGAVTNGIVKQGQWTKYFMPPRRTEFE